MSTQIQQTERLIEAIENLGFVLNNSKHLQQQDYSDTLLNIFISLKEIGYGYPNNGCLGNIHKDLRLLNKTIILAALLMGATKEPEKTLQEYKKIIDIYLK